MITFCHRFPSGLRCVIHADDLPPANGSAHQLKVCWSGGKMKKRYTAEYLEFTKHSTRRARTCGASESLTSSGSVQMFGKCGDSRQVRSRNF